MNHPFLNFANKKAKKRSSLAARAFYFFRRCKSVKYTAEQIKDLIESNALEKFYGSWDWRLLSIKKIRSGHNECTMCKKEHKLTQATVVHHIVPLKAAPELAYDWNNLMPLCHGCHERIHKRGAYAEPKGYQNPERW